MKTHEDVIDLIHDVLPRLPEDALELFDHLCLIGEQAELAEELATTLRALRGSAPLAPVLSDGFADTLMALIAEEAPPAAAGGPSTDLAPEVTSTAEGSPGAQGSGAAGSLPTGAASASAGNPSPGPTASRPGSAPLPAEWTLHSGGAEAQRAPERERWGLALAAAGLLFAAGAFLGSSLSSPLGSSAQLTGEQAVATQEPSKLAVEPQQDEPQQDEPQQDEPQQDEPQQDEPTPDEPAVQVASTSEGARAGESSTLPASLSPEDWQRDPLRAYMTEATYVLEALERLDASDPRVARALAIHLKSTGLVERGQHLIDALHYSPAADDLRPLLNGTQLVLLKVRHAPRPDSAPLNAIRQEVRETRLLAACRGLATQPRSESPAGRDLLASELLGRCARHDDPIHDPSTSITLNTLQETACVPLPLPSCCSALPPRP